MTTQISTRLRTDMAGRPEVVTGASPTLELRTGAPPADCQAADTGVLLSTLTLPADWLGVAASGAVAKNGTWTGNVTTGGNAGHFRIKGGATCDYQGTVSQNVANGGTGDLKLAQATTALVADQPVTIDTWTFTVGGA